MNRAFLIECDFTYYCQGTEDGHGCFLVYADSYEEATEKLRINDKGDCWDFRNFKNRTIM